MQPKVITLFNQKGGVGKTTVSILLSDFYELKKQKVLLLDLDPQGNTSQVFFDFKELKQSPTLYDFFLRKVNLQNVLKKHNDFIHILPAHLQMENLEEVEVESWKTLSWRLLELFKNYDIVILDCPPALNSFSQFGLMLGQFIICPLIPEPFCYQGFTQALTVIQHMKENSEHFIDYMCLVSSYLSHKTIIRKDYSNEYQNQLGEKLFKNSIPNFIGVVERGISKTNIFKMYSTNNKFIHAIKICLTEVDQFFNKKLKKDK